MSDKLTTDATEQTTADPQGLRTLRLLESTQAVLEAELQLDQSGLEASNSTSSGLSQAEIRRRLWHMLPGLFPFVLWAIPHRDPISPTLRNIMIGVVVAMIAWMLPQFHRIRRRGEVGGSAAVLGYSLSVLMTLLLFPAQAEIGLTVLGILAFGDGSATLFGMLFQGRRLPWNADKSWAGTIGFVGVGLPVAALIYWGETHNLEAATPGVAFSTAVLCAGPAVVAAALVESISSRVNDNVRVGIVAATTLVAVHSTVVGW